MTATPTRRIGALDVTVTLPAGLNLSDENKTRLEQAARNIGPVALQAAYCGLFTAALIQSVLTDFGRTMGEPSARFRISCEHIPNARETPNKTV